MLNERQDVAESEPFEVLKRAEETDGAYARFVATLYPSSDASGPKFSLSHQRWAADNVDEHLHPRQEETFKVLSGKFRIVVRDTERTLTQGEEMTLPANTPHKHWNPTNQPVRVIKEDRPAYDSEVFFETLYVLAQDGKTNEEGLPNFLQFAVTQDAYPGHAYIADLPMGIQKSLFALLAPVGRLLGYKASHTRE